MPKKIIRARSNITIGTWIARTLKDVGKLEELQHEMKRYNWNILGLCESRLLKAGEKGTQEGHRLFWSGQDNIHEQGVGLLVHKNTVNCVIDCCPISNRLITIRLRAKPFNITIIQAYAPISAYSNEAVEVFYAELRKVLNKTHKKSLWYKETGMPRLEKMPLRTGKARVGVTATSNQMREASGSWNLPATMI